jgi:hypothetical protein
MIVTRWRSYRPVNVGHWILAGTCMPVFLNSASLGFVVLVGMAFTLGYLNGEVLQDFLL